MSLTENSTHWEAVLDRVEMAIAAAYEDALEVGCMEHGGFGVLAEAAIRAFREGEAMQNFDRRCASPARDLAQIVSELAAANTATSETPPPE